MNTNAATLTYATMRVLALSISTCLVDNGAAILLILLENIGLVATGIGHRQFYVVVGIKDNRIKIAGNGECRALVIAAEAAQYYLRKGVGGARFAAHPIHRSLKCIGVGTHHIKRRGTAADSQSVG